MFFKFIPFIVLSVLLNAGAQLLIRKGMLAAGQLPETLRKTLEYAAGVCMNKWIMAGMASYAVSIVLWMYVLAKVNVSLAYPFQSLGYLFAAFAAFFALGEPLSAQKVIGVAIICTGVFVLSLSPDAMK